MRRVVPLPGLSIIPEPEFRAAAAPLLDEGRVAVIEWTPDVGWAPFVVPAWAERLLEFYGGTGRLYAHGFGLSPLSGAAGDGLTQWLDKIGAEVKTRKYQHVSEHLCFARAGDFTKAGPLPVPMTARTIELGRARIERLAEVVGLPVGLENLATSLSIRDALDQGAFLERLLAPSDGFVLLDLHNLFCQAATFELDPIALLESYPLDRVRELHVSGGSWDEASVDPGRPVRRDTHDGDVPVEVFELLDVALGRCPNVGAVFLERMPGTLGDARDREQLAVDYLAMSKLVRAHARREAADPAASHA